MQRKPIDIGNGRVTASFAIDGSWLSVGALHPDAGMVELVAAPAFTGADGDAHAVRAHRRRLANPAYAALRVHRSVGVWDPQRQEWELRGQGWTGTATAGVAAGEGEAVQHYHLRTPGPGSLRLDFQGRIDRPAMAMITPVGQSPSPLPATRLAARGALLTVRVPRNRVPVEATIEVTPTMCGARASGWTLTGDEAALEVSWDGSSSAVSFDVTVSFVDAGTRDEQQRPSTKAGSARSSSDVLERISDGSRRYTRDCAAITVSGTTTCLLTDHRLLPLSWTRDAYYQAALLLAYGQPDDLGMVERHLAWLWGPGRDVDGVWQRSHFATGEVKDRVYQADQQIYPLLELVDFRRVAGSWPKPPGEPDGWGARVREVWKRFPRHESGLMPGAENPADDPAGLPYQLSSQLLLAYASRRLAQWEVELGLTDLELAAASGRLLTTVEEQFACDGPFGGQWAYECDGADRWNLYHDANDVPTACAPVWGLCDPDDPRWRNTMRFAWSEHNPGYVPGRYGGLGSRHTPGAWPLGDAQEWLVATTSHDSAAADRIVSKLGLVASDDGMLPETYDPDTGEWWARDWFAWPGSLVGLLELTVRRGRGPWVDRGR